MEEIEEVFQEWMERYHPDKMKFNPTIIEVRDKEIIFGMRKHYGRFHIRIDKIILQIP